MIKYPFNFSISYKQLCFITNEGPSISKKKCFGAPKVSKYLSSILIHAEPLLSITKSEYIILLLVYVIRKPMLCTNNCHLGKCFSCTAWKVPSYFYSVFSCIRTEYGYLLCKSLYLKYRKIWTSNNSVLGHFSRNEILSQRNQYRNN